MSINLLYVDGGRGTLGGLTDEIMKEQINKAVEEHFRKEKKYRDKGIKGISINQ